MLRRVDCRSFERVNKELWVALSLFALAAVLNHALDAQRVVLGLYTLPTLFAAFVYGRRYATLTAVASALLVVLIMYFKATPSPSETTAIVGQKWLDVSAWAGTLMVTAYSMGTLYERKEKHVRELRRAYHGVLVILQQFVSKDTYTQNHAYRVSVYAARIAEAMRLSPDRIEDVRAAALLHDVSRIEGSRELLQKATELSERESSQPKVDPGDQRELPQVGSSLRRVVGIVLAQELTSTEKRPLEAHIIAVADAYDTLTTDRPYRKALSPFEAKELVVKGAGTDFDKDVVEGFLRVFQRGQMEVSETIV
jgi:HD-GYP domain-containing protein (c-di-GMP phosphodiesterase class II)